MMITGSFPNNGQSLSFTSQILQPAVLPFNGWVNIDIVLIRLAPSSVSPQAQFGGGKSAAGVGYDVGVCVEVFEPWVAETYNGTAALSVPRTNGIVSPGGMVIGAGDKEGDKELLQGGRGVVVGLNATGKENVFRGAQANARNLLSKVCVFDCLSSFSRVVWCGV